MGAICIQYSLSMSQTELILRDIKVHLAGFIHFGVSGFEGLYAGDIHVFADFKPLPYDGFCLELDLPDKKAVEILNKDYELIEADTEMLRIAICRLLAEIQPNRYSGDGYSILEELSAERYYSHKYGI